MMSPTAAMVSVVDAVPDVAGIGSVGAVGGAGSGVEAISGGGVSVPGSLGGVDEQAASSEASKAGRKRSARE
jgi:hypothetical protein